MGHFPPEAAAELLEVLRDLARSHDIELPALDAPPKQRAMYENYVRSVGFNPDDVDPMIDFARLPLEDRGEIHATLLMALMKADSLSRDELQAVILYATTLFGEHRAGGLVQKLTEELVAYCTAQGVKLPELASGVFPMSWFNAQCALYQNAPIILLSNGCMSLLEIAVIMFMAATKDRNYAIHRLREAVVSYVDSGGSVARPEHDLGKGRVDFSSPLLHSLTNAAEQFVIAHELAHAALGHVTSRNRYSVPVAGARHGFLRRLVRFLIPRLGRKDAIAVVNKNHFQEHQADLWAYRLMLQRAKNTGGHEAAVPVAAASAGIFLGVNLLVEAAFRERGVALGDSHPDGSTRLYMVQLLTELEGCHEQGYVARRFYEFLEEVGEQFPGFEMPPLLCRDRNSAAIPVFESLKIDLSNASFITDFS